MGGRCVVVYMKINETGLWLINCLRDEDYELDGKTAAEKAVRTHTRTRLTDGQYSALVSFVMCEGIDLFMRSKLRRLINRGELVEAADEFDRYIYTVDDEGKRVVDPFLLKHRELEKGLFLMPELVRKRK